MALCPSPRTPVALAVLTFFTGLLWTASGCGTETPSAGSGGLPTNTGGAAASAATGGVGAGATGGIGLGGSAAGPATGGVGAGGAVGAGGGGSTGGAATGGADPNCIPEAVGKTTHSAGNYDNVSCNKADCHMDEVGGWVYASAKGYPWVAGVTITITNPDGTELTAVSGPDGFFDFGSDPPILSPYKVCASKCPSTNCNLTTHTSVDCLSANCHSLKTQRTYVTTSDAGTGGSGPVAGENCEQPAPGGPYVHLESVYSTYNNQPCVNCHLSATPNYKGGFLYDGPDSTTTVAGATITLTPDDGSAPLTAIAGPDGMFFFGTYGQTTTADEIPTGYIACVSKCPTSAVCSAPGSHPTGDDCGTCHNGSTTGKVYLR
jgi:hypothetical protein